LIIAPHPSFTLFPYTTLFRSGELVHLVAGRPAPAASQLERRLVRPVAERQLYGPPLSRELGSLPGGRPRLRVPGWDRSVHHDARSEEHTSELQSRGHLVCRLL